VSNKLVLSIRDDFQFSKPFGFGNCALGVIFHLLKKKIVLFWYIQIAGSKDNSIEGRRKILAT
jgi:hypothetical protein